MPPVTMNILPGRRHRVPARSKHLEPERRGIDSGSVMVGENASIMAGSHSQGGRIIPESVMKQTPRPPEVVLRCKAGNHFDNWTWAIKGQDTAMSPFEYAGPLSEIIVLGDIALVTRADLALGRSEHEDHERRGGRQKSLHETPGPPRSPELGLRARDCEEGKRGHSTFSAGRSPGGRSSGKK